MITRKEDIPERELEAPELEGQPLLMRTYITRDKHSENISITWVKLSGKHSKMVNELSDRVYYIIDGKATFMVGDKEPGRVTKGDFVFIPKGTPYSFEGSITFLVMNGPAFVSGSDKIVE